MFTVSEAARLLHISPQRLYKIIAEVDNQVDNLLKANILEIKRNGKTVKALNEKAIAIISQRIGKRNQTEVDNEVDNQNPEIDNQVDNQNNQVLEILKQQLEVKDRQIEALNEQLQNQAELLRNTQVLLLNEQQKALPDPNKKEPLWKRLFQ